MRHPFDTYRQLLAGSLLILLLGGCDALPIEEEPEPPGPLELTAEPAPEWTALFDRTSGWTGADGIFSVPANGVNTPGTAGQTTTTFLFADTVIGEVLPSGRRATGARIVNNTLATLRGGAPDPSRMEFHWRTEGGQPRAVVAPDTPEAGPNTWYWNQDGVVLGNTLHSLFLRLGPAPGAFPFEVVGVALVSFTVTDGLPTDVRQRDTPFFRAPAAGRGDIQFGAGILANTAAAGAPHPDGYVYVYGIQNDPSAKKLLAARVRPEDFEDFARWRFWDGEAWSPSLDDAAPLTDRVSNELSVTPLTDGRYLLVFQLDTWAPYVAVRVGGSPVGPWGEFERVYRAPEVDGGDPNTFVYNAKAHPHLSAPGELLVSYNVNTFDFFGAFFADASLYRPRFIRLSGLPR
jgi:hypothetical protein